MIVIVSSGLYFTTLLKARAARKFRRVVQSHLASNSNMIMEIGAVLHRSVLNIRPRTLDTPYSIALGNANHETHKTMRINGINGFSLIGLLLPKSLFGSI